MLKSILKGGTLGILLSGTAAIGIAMLFPAPPSDVPPATPQMDVPVASVDPSGDRDVAALDVMTDSPRAEDAPAPAVVVADVEDPSADTTPLTEPEVADVDGEMMAPEAVVDVAVAATGEDPVLPSPQTLAPQAPAEETQVAISTAPAAVPVQPVIVDETPVEQPVGPVIVDDTPVEDAEAADTDAAMADELEDEVVEIDTNPSAQVVAPAVIGIVTEDGQTLPRGDGAVQVNRLTEETDDAPGEVTTEADKAAPADPTAPALVRYAAAFENPDNKPLMSIVLHDRNEMAAPLLSLSQLNFPVTVVIDPSSNGASERMKLYREEGLEVAIMTSLPQGATPSDIEIILTGVFAQVPETMALVDTGDTGLQADRDVIEQTMAILAEEGRGLLTISRGLNTALRAADEAGVPSTTIYRDIDPEWQSARVISRFLDQSAFRARQQSGVVLFGRLRPNTLTALKNWGRSTRAQQIALAPLSAVLNTQD